MDDDMPRSRSRDRVIEEWVWSGEVPWLPMEHPVRDDLLGSMVRNFPMPRPEQSPRPPLARENQRQVTFDPIPRFASWDENLGAQQTAEHRHESAPNAQTVDEAEDKTGPNASQVPTNRTRHSSLIDLPFDGQEYYHSLTDLYKRNLSSVPVHDLEDLPSLMQAGQHENFLGASSSSNSLALPASLAQIVPAPPRGILIRRPSSEIPWSITATGGPSDNESFNQADQEEYEALTKCGQEKSYSGATAAQRSPMPQGSIPGGHITLPEPSYRLATGLSEMYFPNLKSNQLVAKQKVSQRGMSPVSIGPFMERSKQPVSPAAKKTSKLTLGDKTFEEQPKDSYPLPFPIDFSNKTLKYPSEIVKEYPNETIKKYSRNISSRLSQTPSQLPGQSSNQQFNQLPSLLPSQAPTYLPIQLSNPPTRPPSQPLTLLPSQPPSQPPKEPSPQTLGQYSVQPFKTEPNNGQAQQRISLFGGPSFSQTSERVPRPPSGQLSREKLKLPYNPPPYRPLPNQPSQLKLQIDPQPGPGYTTRRANSLEIEDMTPFNNNENETSDQAVVPAGSALHRSYSMDRVPTGTVYPTGRVYSLEPRNTRNTSLELQTPSRGLSFSLEAERPQTLRSLLLSDSRSLVSGARQDNTRDSKPTTKVKQPTGPQSMRSRLPLTDSHLLMKLWKLRQDGRQAAPAAAKSRKSGQRSAPGTGVGFTGSHDAQNSKVQHTCGLTMASNTENHGSLPSIKIPYCNCKVIDTENNLTDLSHATSLFELPLENLPLKKRYTRQNPEQTDDPGYQDMFSTDSNGQRYSTEASRTLEAAQSHEHPETTLEVPKQTNTTQAEESSEDHNVEEFYSLDTSPFKASGSGTGPSPQKPLALSEYSFHISPTDNENLLDERHRQKTSSRHSKSRSSSGKRRSKSKARHQTSDGQSGQKPKSPRKHGSSKEHRKDKDSEDRQRADGQNRKGHSKHMKPSLTSVSPNDKGQSASTSHYVDVASTSHHYVDVASTRQDEHQNDVIERRQLDEPEFPGTAATERGREDLFSLDVTSVRAMIADLDQTFGYLGQQTESRGQLEDKTRRISEGETTDTASETGPGK